VRFWMQNKKNPAVIFWPEEKCGWLKRFF